MLRGTYTRRLTGTTAFNLANDLWRVARVTFRDASTCDIVAVDDVVSTSASITMP
ncbi:MAG: hypothetical protein U0324_33050 [Polyangiales bacterium]